MKSRVVVTGMGVVSPIGTGLSRFREALFAGASGADRVTLFDASGLSTRFAAEVDWPREENALRDRKIEFALRAAAEAVTAASAGGSPPGGERGGQGAGLSLGVGLELFSMDDLAAAQKMGYSPPVEARARLTFLQTPSDLCLHLISRRHGLCEAPLAHVSACAAGADAIGAAFRMVASGRRRWMLAGGTDSMINPLGLGGFSRISALSRANEAPSRASRPFDRRRDGFVLGEGAGVLVLERLEDAAARGAPIHAEIAGYGSSLDAHGISEPHPEGRGALEAMRGAIEEAGIATEEIDSINAHGTATPKGDRVETLAIRRLLGRRASRVSVVATKSMIGHLIAAAGAVETIAAIACLEAGVLHPTINLEEPDPECDLDYVPGRARRQAQRCVLSNSFGFGGQNASLALRRIDERL